MAEPSGAAAPAKTCFQSSGKKRNRGLLLLCVLLPFVLACWQGLRGMDAWQREQALAQAASQPAQSWSAVPLAQAPDYSRHSMAGVRPQGAVILLANSLLDEQPGARLLLPVRLADDSMLLLDLGWLADSRPQPSLSLPPLLRGQWLPWHARWTLPGAQSGIAGRVDQVAVAALPQAYPGRWRQGVLVLQPALPGLQAWPLQPALSAQRHFAYALQWAVLALCLLLLLRPWQWPGRWRVR
nr:SURF1 family cytochrome oxidase biogenesis protein [Aquitalea aquatilis]